MKKILQLIFIVFAFLAIFFYPKNSIQAQNPPFNCGFKVTCNDPSIGPNECKTIPNTNQVISKSDKMKFVFDLSQIPSEGWNHVPTNILTYELFTYPDSSVTCPIVDHTGKISGKTDTVEDLRIDSMVTNPLCGAFRNEDTHQFNLAYTDSVTGDVKKLCVGNYSIIPFLDAEIEIKSTDGNNDVDSEWDVTIKNVIIKRRAYDPLFTVNFEGKNLNNDVVASPNYLSDKGNLNLSYNLASETENPPYVYFRLKKLNPGTYTIDVQVFTTSTIVKTASFTVLAKGAPTLTPSPPNTPTLPPAPGAPTPTFAPPVPNTASICDSLHPQFVNKCKECHNKPGEGGHIWTAIGCLPIDFPILVKDYVFTLGISTAGGISFLYFLYGVFLVLTSAGNAETIGQAKQIIVSALSGLLLIIFSIFLLRVIGVDILKLPGFS